MKDEEYREFEASIRDYMRIHLNEHYADLKNPVRTTIIERTNALIYRSSAVQWNYNHLKGTTQSSIDLIFSQGRSEIYPNTINHLFPLSFCFDDIVFNLVSMIDYTAMLMISIISANRSKSMKWNNLRKKLNDDDLGFPETANLVKKIHEGWVNRLSEYRAGVYHNNNQFVAAEHWSDYLKGTENLSFYLPDMAARQLPIFDRNKKVDMIAGAEALVDGTFDKVKQLLKLCYSEKP
ncbi:hypothetical protein [Microbulbifer sediminum]|uniref:hypothetical protein n=1 Tax=Microbulbifer sediminum TaxID=2904250 RepID=UPI001F2EB7A0|nr:hypothetical protein [Microbulbifer sediminum]